MENIVIVFKGFRLSVSNKSALVLYLGGHPDFTVERLHLEHCDQVNKGESVGDMKLKVLYSLAGQQC